MATWPSGTDRLGTLAGMRPVMYDSLTMMLSPPVLDISWHSSCDASCAHLAGVFLSLSLAPLAPGWLFGTSHMRLSYGCWLVISWPGDWCWHANDPARWLHPALTPILAAVWAQQALSVVLGGGLSGTFVAVPFGVCRGVG